MSHTQSATAQRTDFIPRASVAAIPWPGRVFHGTGGMDADVLVEEETETAETLDVPWQVVVHNDPINLMEYVTKVFMRVLGFPREKAEIHMLEVHKNGRSIVWQGARERAEFYAQQLQQHLLMANIEQTK